jgi:hypothetical protein
LLLGRLFSKHLFWIISAESSQVFTPRSSSSLVLCNFPCSAALLWCRPLSSLLRPCNLLSFFASPSCCLPTGWAGFKSFFVTFFLYFNLISGGRCPTIFVQKKSRIMIVTTQEFRCVNFSKI